VPQKVIVEHFTNTYCSICAARNPSFYSNVRHYPQVLHIAYHPSAPYAACPLSQHNQPEADARTNYYGVYGGTPRIVIQGKVIDGSANYGDTMLFSTELGKTSAFELGGVTITATSASMGKVRFIVRKVAASSLDTLRLYGALVEDTLFFTANNGETQHYDVFRKELFAGSPVGIAAPGGIGDSVEYTQYFYFNSAWNLGRIYATVILQDDSKAVIQAERTANLPAELSVPEVSLRVAVFPVPARDMLMIDGLPSRQYKATITDMRGVLMMTATISGSIDISALGTGIYVLRLQGDDTVYTTRFLKE
jgi:hypothetical protein